MGSLMPRERSAPHTPERVREQTLFGPNLHRNSQPHLDCPPPPAFGNPPPRGRRREPSPPPSYFPYSLPSLSTCGHPWGLLTGGPLCQCRFSHALWVPRSQGFHITLGGENTSHPLSPKCQSSNPNHLLTLNSICSNPTLKFSTWMLPFLHVKYMLIRRPLVPRKLENEELASVSSLPAPSCSPRLPRSLALTVGRASRSLGEEK